MASIRIASFNTENLLRRFDFWSYGQLKVNPALRLLGAESDSDAMTLRRAQHVVVTDDVRQMTAQAIRDTEADVICLQEIDNRTVLDDFHEQYLEKSTGVHYGWRRLIEGNDNRGIDVAVMSKQSIKTVSHKNLTFEDLDLFNTALNEYGLQETDPVFRRDCLEVNLKVVGNPLTLFVCHFKSMAGGRDETRPIREAEAKAVRKIIEKRFNDPKKSNWLVLGDLNDYIDGNEGIGTLVENGFSVNLLERVEDSERWTHYYPIDRAKHQLDYILSSPAIARINPNAVPTIIRGGMPFRVPGLENVVRYPRVGFDRPKASDHCPVAVTLDI